MKLSLKSQNGIEVLTGGGEISAHDLQILRAGIMKLFQSGKNKIVLEIPEAEKLPPEILREVSKLDLMARELSGRLVLAGVNTVLREQITRFAQPPVIQCFDSKEDAIKHLHQSPSQSQPAPVTAAPPPSPSQAPAPAPTPAQAPAPAAPAPTGEASADHAQQYKTDIRQKELGDLGSLRKTISSLENENKLLRDQLIVAITHRREAHSEIAAQKQIEALEKKLEEMLDESKPAAGAAGAKPPAK